MDREITNAEIESVSLGFEGHGIFTFNINVHYGGGSTQGCGGYALSEHTIHRPVGTEILTAILKTVGCNEWNELEGTPIRVDRRGHRIVAIGHYIKDEWLHFGNFCESYPNDKTIIEDLQKQVSAFVRANEIVFADMARWGKEAATANRRIAALKGVVTKMKKS